MQSKITKKKYVLLKFLEKWEVMAILEENITLSLSPDRIIPILGR